MIHPACIRSSWIVEDGIARPFGAPHRSAASRKRELARRERAKTYADRQRANRSAR